MSMKYKNTLMILAAFAVLVIAWRTGDNFIKFGDGTSSDKAIEVDMGNGATNPKMRYNGTSGKWDYTNDGTVFKDVGSGSGGGGFSILEEPGFEDGALGDIELYADAVQALPEDGEGAGADTITVATQSSAPLIEKFSLRITHEDAENGQGEGVAVPFTMPLGLKTHMISVQFYYKVSADFSYGNFFDCVNNPSDITVHVIDSDADERIELTQVCLDGAGFYRGVFQAPASSTNFRLVFHNATANTDDWTFDVDNLLIGTESAAVGPIITSWKAYTPVWEGGTITATNQIGQWRRVGDSMEVIASATITAVSSNIAVNIPDGYTVDITKVANSDNKDPLGIAHANDTTTGYNYTGVVRLWAVEGNKVRITGSDSPIDDVWDQARPFDWTTNDGVIGVRFVIPIQGWDGTSSLSSDASTRVLGCEMYQTGTQAVSTTGSDVLVQFNSQTGSVVTWGSCDHANNRIDFIESGTYYCYYGIRYDGGASFPGVLQTYFYKNGDDSIKLGGVINQDIIASTDYSHTGGALININAGDYVAAYVTISGNSVDIVGATATDYTKLGCFKVQGPQSIASNEKVYARYQRTNTAGIANGDTVDYEDAIYDSHNAVSTGVNWKFTAPYANLYSVSATLMFSEYDWLEDTYCEFRFTTDSGTFGILDRWDHNVPNATSLAFYLQVNGSDSVWLDAGESLWITVAQNSGGARAIFGTGTYSYITIVGQ